MPVVASNDPSIDPIDTEALPRVVSVDGAPIRLGGAKVRTLDNSLPVDGVHSYVRALAWQMHVEKSSRNAALAWSSIRDPGGISLDGVLGSAAAFLGIGEAVGSVGGPLGKAVGAIGGVVVGAITGFLPAAREAMLTRFRSRIARLTPFERLCAIAQAKPYARAAMQKDGVNIAGQYMTESFRYGDDPVFGHNSATGGATSFVVLCIESLLKTNIIDSRWFGASAPENEALFFWWLSVVMGFHDDTKIVQNARWAWIEKNIFEVNRLVGFTDSNSPVKFASGTQTPVDRAYKGVGAVRTYQALSIRTQCSVYGITLWNPPLSENMVKIELS